VNWSNPPKDYDNLEGFIYEITNTTNNKKYIGRKTFWKRVKLKPLKGRKNKRHRKTDSDWATYTGSSTQLNSDIAKIGIDKFKFRIIHLCESKTEMNYYEPYYLWKAHALTSNYYNKQIPACRHRPKKF
jgi:hypothetical protein